MDSEDLFAGLPDTEYGAAEVLASIRWPSGFVCPVCAGLGATHLRCRPRVFECKVCKRPVSVTAGTALHRCRVSLCNVLRAARLLAREGSISSNQLSKHLDVRWETAWKLGHRLRAAIEFDLDLLEEPVVVWGGTCAHRKRHKDEREHLPHLIIVTDATGRAAADVSDRLPFAIQRLMGRHCAGPGLPPRDREIAAPLAKQIARVLYRIHRGVTRRWIRRYVVALCWLQQRRDEGQEAANALLAAALATRPRSIHRMAPARITGEGWRYGR